MILSFYLTSMRYFYTALRNWRARTHGHSDCIKKNTYTHSSALSVERASPSQYISLLRSTSSLYFYSISLRYYDTLEWRWLIALVVLDNTCWLWTVSYSRILSVNVCYVFVIKQLWWTLFSLYFLDIIRGVFLLFKHPTSQNRSTMQYQPHCNHAVYDTNQINDVGLLRNRTLSTHGLLTGQIASQLGTDYKTHAVTHAHRSQRKFIYLPWPLPQII